MIRRCIGIDIGSSYLHAVQVSRVGDRFCVERVFSTQTQRSTDSHPDILKSLIKRHGFDRRADVAIAVPHDAIFFANLKTDIGGLEGIRGGCLPALEHSFPVQTDRIVHQACSCRQLSENEYSVLVAAVPKASLRERLNVLTAAKMRASLAEAPVFAAYAAVVVNHPEINDGGKALIAHISESRLVLAVVEKNSVLMVRNIPLSCGSDGDVDLVREQLAEVLVHEVEITWRKLFDGRIKPDTKIYVVAEDGDFGDIAAAIEQGLRCQAVFADPYARVEGPPEFNGGAAVCVAEGLALRVLAQEKTAGTNFLEAETAGTKPGLDLKKELVFCSVLAVVIAAVCLAGLYIRLFYLEREYEWLTGEIKGLFQRTVPEEKNIVNPVVQLEQKLKSLQADSALSGFVAGSSVGPLEVLRAITATAPSEASITINSMLITGSSLRLTGNSQSFESVYAWRQRLQGASQFSAAEVRDIARSSEGEPVNFTMLMSLAKE